MKKMILPRPLALVAGILFVFPSLYFVLSALLNYGLGLPPFWKLIEPIFEKPENKYLGFNINLIIIFGPFLAILVSLQQVMRLHFMSGREELNIQFAIKRYTWSWVVIGLSLFCLAAIGFYLIAENCFC